MRVAVYARYSSDKQKDASIEDQMRLCGAFAKGRGWQIAEEYADDAISGSTSLRPGLQKLLRDAQQHKFDLVLAESLDRLNRDLEDTAALFKRLTFLAISLVTVSEGEITQLHVGFKGTMNALYFKDLAEMKRTGFLGDLIS